MKVPAPTQPLKPNVPQNVADKTVELHEFYDGAELRLISSGKSQLSGAIGKRVILQQLLLRKANLMEADLPELQASDLKLDECDLSNAQLLEASFHRFEAQNSRLTGLQAGGSFFSEVLYQGCRMDLVNFRFCEFSSVVLKDCDLRGTDFQGSTFKKVRFEHCELEGAQFRQCRVESLDFRSSNVAGLLGVEALKGAIISSGQAVDLSPTLAHALGIAVED
jgi:uncharacterized protein YjbI with pentapeptide repeats